MNYESSTKQILNVLGKDNIQSATHSRMKAWSMRHSTARWRHCS